MQAIYQIRNIANNKIYIGSTNNVRKRWNNHRSKLNNGKHENQYLQLAWQKYGENSFEFTIIEEVNDNNRIEREIYHLNEKKSYERNIGYNFDKIEIVAHYTSTNLNNGPTNNWSIVGIKLLHKLR